MTDVVVAALTVLIASGGVGSQLAVEGAIWSARAKSLRRLQQACERTRAENARALGEYAEARSWERLFPLTIAGTLRGVVITIAQSAGSDPRTTVAAQALRPIDRALLARDTAPSLARIPRVRVEVVAPNVARVDWPAETVDAEALDATIDALLSSLATPKETGAYR